MSRDLPTTVNDGTVARPDHARRTRNLPHRRVGGLFATSPDLRLRRGFGEDTTILRGGTPQYPPRRQMASGAKCLRRSTTEQLAADSQYLYCN